MNREFTVTFAANAYAWIANNLNEPRQWCGDQMRGMLSPGRFLFVYGTFYHESGGFNFEAQYLIFVGAASRTNTSSRSRTGGSGRSSPSATST